MPELRSEPIRFAPQQSQGWDELGGAMPQALNVTVDGAGVVRRRPGIQAYAGAPVGVIDANGLTSVYETANGSLFAVGGGLLRSVYQIIGGVAHNRSMLSGVQLSGTSRPVVAETDAMVVYTDGGVPVRLLLSSPSLQLLGGSPPSGSHVLAMNARLLLNDTANPSHVRASGPQLGTLDITGHETWTMPPGALVQAEARPDAVVALAENAGELYVYGSRSLQAFLPDEDSVFAPVVTLDTGVSAPASIIKSNQTLVWLDQERRFVMGDARGVQSLSGPIQRELHEAVAVSDCYGYRVSLGHVDAFVWTMPTDMRTWVYAGGWSQWCQHSGGAVTPFPVLSHFRRTGGGAENLVGLSDGRLCKLQLGVGDDLGTPITAAVTTGFQDHGTLRRKKSWRVRACLRRGTGSSSGTTAGLLMYRDDLGPWSDGIPIGVGSPGDSNPVVEVFGVGWPYRKRQWRFEFSHSADFALVSVMEDFEVCET